MISPWIYEDTNNRPFSMIRGVRLYKPVAFCMAVSNFEHRNVSNFAFVFLEKSRLSFKKNEK